MTLPTREAEPVIPDLLITYLERHTYQRSACVSTCPIPHDQGSTSLLLSQGIQSSEPWSAWGHIHNLLGAGSLLLRSWMEKRPRASSAEIPHFSPEAHTGGVWAV